VGRALFAVIGLANHSCAPNARVQQRHDEEGAAAGGGAKPSFSAARAPVYTLEARAPIAAGDEVTIAYVPRAWAKSLRLQQLQQWGFTCACPRCAAPWDDTIVVRCLACGTGRVYFPDAGSEGACCQDCGAAVSLAGTPAEHADAYDIAPFLQTRAEPAGGAAGGAGSAASDAAATNVPPGLALARRLLQHPWLAHEDMRIFSGLNELLGALAGADPSLPLDGQGDSSGAAGSDGATGALDAELAAELAAATTFGDLFGVVAKAVTLAAMRSGYTSPGDLGITVEVDDGSG
jgi:hypothetical protein